MAIVFQQAITTNTGNNSTNGTATFGSNVTAGNLIVVFVATYSMSGSVSPAVSDSLGNTYFYMGQPGSPASGVSCYYAYNCLGGACTVTATKVGSCYMTVGCLEYSGASIYSPLDAFINNSIGSGAFSGTATPSTGTLNFPSTTVLVLAAFEQGASTYTTTAGSGFTKRVYQTNGTSSVALTVEEKSPTNSSLNPSLTYSTPTSCFCLAVAFRPNFSVSSTITPVSGNANGIQGAQGSGAITLTYPKTTTGQLLVAAVSVNGGITAPTLTDNKGNTWTKAVQANSTNLWSQIWYCSNPAVGSNHQVTVTPSGSAYVAFAINEYTIATGNVVLDQTNHATGNSTSPSSGAVTTASNNELYVGCLGLDVVSTIVQETGWSNIYINPATSAFEGISFQELGDITAQIASSQTATWILGTSGVWAATIATFNISYPFIDHIPVLGVS